MYTFNSKEELAEWISRELVGTNEVMEIMNCSRQNVHLFVKRGKLIPVKDSGKERLFFRSDVMERMEQAAAYHRKKE